jgi:hypothetical protein
MIRPRVRKGIREDIDPKWWPAPVREQIAGACVPKQETRNWAGFASMLAGDAWVARSRLVFGICRASMRCVFTGGTAAPPTSPCTSRSSASYADIWRAKESQCWAVRLINEPTIRTAFAIIIDASQDKMDWAAELMADVGGARRNGSRFCASDCGGPLLLLRRLVACSRHASVKIRQASRSSNERGGFYTNRTSPPSKRALARVGPTKPRFRISTLRSIRPTQLGNQGFVAPDDNTDARPSGPLGGHLQPAGWLTGTAVTRIEGPIHGERRNGAIRAASWTPRPTS